MRLEPPEHERRAERPAADARDADLGERPFEVGGQRSSGRERLRQLRILEQGREAGAALGALRQRRELAVPVGDRQVGQREPVAVGAAPRELILPARDLGDDFAVGVQQIQQARRFCRTGSSSSGRFSFAAMTRSARSVTTL